MPKEPCKCGALDCLVCGVAQGTVDLTRHCEDCSCWSVSLGCTNKEMGPCKAPHRARWCEEYTVE